MLKSISKTRKTQCRIDGRRSNAKDMKIIKHGVQKGANNHNKSFPSLPHSLIRKMTLWSRQCPRRGCQTTLTNHQSSLLVTYIDTKIEGNNIILVWYTRRELFSDNQTRPGRLRAQSGLKTPCGVDPADSALGVRRDAFCELWRLNGRGCVGAVGDLYVSWRFFADS